MIGRRSIYTVTRNRIEYVRIIVIFDNNRAHKVALLTNDV